MRRAVAAAAGVGLLVLAGLVTWSAPDASVLQGPIVVRADPGERAQGRNIAATVRGIELARVARGPGWTGTTSGVWLIVHLRAEALLTSGAVTGSVAVGDRTWIASDRAPTSLSSASLDPELPVDGDLLFELPRSATRGRAVLQLGSTVSPQLDSAIRVDLDLGSLHVRSSASTDDPQRVER